MFCEKLINVCKKWRLWILPLTIVLYSLAIAIFIPLFIAKSMKDGFTRKDQEILVGGIFVIVALPISFYEIIQHVIHFTQPKLQKHIIRILWMVPIYAINAWLGLVYPKHSVFMDCARECYEAYVIYNFMVYLLNYLNMEIDLEACLELKSQVYHIFPLCCLPPWTMGTEFVHLCKHGILQYTVVRPVTTFMSFICKLSGVYGGGQFRADVAFPYLVVVNNLSQFAAMYCLVLFYKATASELKPMRPLPKFLCIKAVVFFSFFQGVLIDLLVYFGIFVSKSNDPGDGLNISTRLQNVLICIEMCIAAITHHYIFSYESYVNDGEYRSCCRSFLAMWDVSDMHRDVQEHLGIVRSSISRRIRGRNTYEMSRGDEYSSLMTRPSTSAMNNYLYQNDEDETAQNYGATRNLRSTDSVKSTNEDLIDV